MKKRGKGNTEWVEKPPGKICGEAMQLLEAERYEIYPTHYYTRSSFRKQGHEEIGLSCILLKAVYGAVNPGSLYGDLLEPTGGVLIPFPALNSGYIALPILIPFVALWGGPTSSHVHLIENGCTYHCFRCSCATLSLLEHLCPQRSYLPLRIIDHVRSVAKDHGGAPVQIVGRPGWQAGDGRIAAADKSGP